ncbi:MAG: 4Fe-4S dicluster domain-containing protein [Candidatus Caldatribacteriaceae bacterium]
MPGSNGNSANILEAIKAMGVVGAGGGGFPTHLKISHSCDIVIANGSECEPLLANDKVVMEEEASLVAEGLEWAVKVTGARKGTIALKGKGSKAEIALLGAVKEREGIEIFNLGDYYPAGDEFLLVQEVTGRIVPEGDIPLSVGVVVLNVETLRNVAQAMRGRPVIERTLTCQGEVRRPSVLRVRIGTPFWEVFERCGGVTVSDYVVVVGGPMMGSVVSDPLTPVTKTTTGLFVLPKDHALVQKKALPLPFIVKQSKAACCQCTYCTEFCPRYLLGHDLAPHKIMRQISLGLDVPPQVIENAFLCSECGLCEVFACPMGLSPRVVNHVIKERFLQAQYRPTFPRREFRPRETFSYRKVPVSILKGRLRLYSYEARSLSRVLDVPPPQRVELLLKQHAGLPAQAVVKVGNQVKEGDLVGEAMGEVSARVHASITGRVVFVDGERVIIERA